MPTGENGQRVCTDTSWKRNRNYSYVCDRKGNLSRNQDVLVKSIRLYLPKMQKVGSARLWGGFGANSHYRCSEPKSALLWTLLSNSCPLDPATLLLGTYCFSYLFVGFFFCILTGSFQHTNNSKRTITIML